MSRDDYDDDYDRPRRRRRPRDDDYDDYEDDVRRRSGPSSGSVTSVGVVSIILGSLLLLCGICFMVASLGIAGAGAGGPAANIFPVQVATGVFIVIAVLFLVLGVLYMVGGIGVIQRRIWVKIMT